MHIKLTHLRRWGWFAVSREERAVPPLLPHIVCRARWKMQSQHWKLSQGSKEKEKENPSTQQKNLVTTLAFPKVMRHGRSCLAAPNRSGGLVPSLSSLSTAQLMTEAHGRCCRMLQATLALLLQAVGHSVTPGSRERDPRGGENREQTSTNQVCAISAQ